MTEQTTPQPEAQPKPVGFSLNDLRALQHIVDVCSTRGAFKAEELTSIGVIYDRLTAFLAASDAASAEAAKQQAEAAGQVPPPAA
jgi:hypothetical protein